MANVDEQWRANDDDSFWARPTVAQQLAAKRKADKKAFEMGWRRIFYATAAATLLATGALMLLR